MPPRNNGSGWGAEETNQAVSLIEIPGRVLFLIGRGELGLLGEEQAIGKASIDIIKK